MTFDQEKTIQAFKAYFKMINENTNLAKHLVEKAERGEATPDEIELAQQYLKKMEEQSRFARNALDVAKRLQEEKT